MEDERTGQRHDYTRIDRDLVFEGMFAPANAPAWSRDRETFWNRVETVERRKDAQLAHELNIALPHELTDEQRRHALQDWIKEITRKGYVVDAAIHRPHDYGDERNHHAHVMIALRKLDISGNDLDKDKDRYSLKTLGEQMDQWRERWSHHANRHLKRAGFDIEIDHRTLEEQGMERAATVHLGKAAAGLERRGVETERGDVNRSIEDAEQKRARLTAELDELERLYKLEQDAVSFSQAETAAQRVEEVSQELDAAEVVDRQQAAAKIEETSGPEHISAVERLREEEYQEEQLRQRQHATPALRMLVTALWNLTKTLASSLSHVILSADRASLMQGRQVDPAGMGKPTPPAPDRTPAANPTPPPKFDPRYAREEVTGIRREASAPAPPPPFDKAHARDQVGTSSNAPPRFDPSFAREEVGTPADRLQAAAKAIADRQAAAKRAEEEQQRIAARKAQSAAVLKERGIIDSPLTPGERLQQIATQAAIDAAAKTRQEKAVQEIEDILSHKTPADQLRTDNKRSGRKMERGQWIDPKKPDPFGG